MHRDEPADVVQELFAAAMFPGHPLGREVLGEPEVITQGHRARRSGRSSTPTTCRATWSSRRPATSTTSASRPASRPASPAATAASPPSAQAPSARPVAARRRVARHRAGAARPRRAGARTATRPTASPSPCSTTSSAGACPAGSSRRSARRGASPTRSARTAAPTTTPARSRSRSAPRPSNAHEVLELLHAELDRLAAEGITARELEVAKGPPPCRPALVARGLRLADVADRLGAAAVRHGAHRRGAARPASRLSPPTRCEAVAEEVLVGPEDARGGRALLPSRTSS